MTSTWRHLQKKVKHWLFTPKHQQAFLEDVSSLVEDGIPPNQAVEVVSKLATGLTLDVADNVLIRIAEGKYLADGMQGWFAQPVVEIVRAGEEGGTLGKTLQIASKSLARKTNAIKSLLNSVTYPLVVIILGLAVTIFINHFIFKAFASIKSVSLWPSNAQDAVALANFVEGYWWLIIMFGALLIFLISLLLRNYAGEGRKYLDKIPLFSLYRDLTAARLMETLGLLVTNGIILKKALKILRYNVGPYLGTHLLTMEYRLSGGKENIAEVLDTGLIREYDLMRLRVLAMGRGFEYALSRQGLRANEQTMETVQTMGRILGGVLLTIAAFLAAFLIFAIYSVGAFISM